MSGTVRHVARAGKVGKEPRLAGYLIAGPDYPLDSGMLRDFIALVRSEAGFDDSVVKRCAPGESVGVRLVHEPSVLSGKSPQATSDVVLDFGCNKLIVGATETLPEAYVTYFDPSRSAFVELAKRMLPLDTALKKMRSHLREER